MNPIPFLFPLFGWFGTQARPDFFQDRYSSLGQVSLYSEGNFESSHMNGWFVSQALIGRSFTQADMMSVQADGQGYASGRWETGFRYWSLDSAFGGGAWRHSLGFSNTWQGYASYDADLFGLISRGNAPFAGQSLPLNSSTGFLTNYQTIDFSLARPFHGPNASWFIGFGLGFVNGSFFRDAQMQGGSFYTHPEGDELRLGMNQVQLRASDPSGSAFLYPAGLGFSFRGSLEYQHKKGHVVSFSVQDAGLMFWNRQGQTIELDSELVWSGFEVPNIAEVAETLFQDQLDSIAGDLVVLDQRRSFETMLPVGMRLGYGRRLFQNTALLQAQMYYAPYCMPIPELELAFYYLGKGRLNAGISASGGGVCLWKIGLNVGVDAGKGWAFQLFTRNAESIWPNAAGRGFSAGFQISKRMLKS
ncbi:MAG: DUF5723 family protein [Bacteroidetes bacterium]|nr:DUF5723 family protein [Bacteroidota bacterium]